MTLAPPELLAYLKVGDRGDDDPPPAQTIEERAASPYARSRFDAAMGVEGTKALAEALGYHSAERKRGGHYELTRPGKDSRDGSSVTVGKVAPWAMMVFTSSDPRFEDGRAYDAHELYAILHYDGDLARAEQDFVATYGGERAHRSPEELAEGLSAFEAHAKAEEGRTAALRASGEPVYVVESSDPSSPLAVLDAHTYTEEELALLPPPRWWIPEWIPETGLISIYGPSNGGKTFYVLDLLLTLTTGQPSWHGIDLGDYEAPRALMLLGEGLTGIKYRIDAWRKARGVTAPARLEYTGLAQVDLRDPLWAETIAARCDRDGIDIVFIDTLSQFGGAMDENSPKDMMEFVNGCKAIRGNDKRLVGTNHHSGKDETRGSRGHSSHYAALDYEINVRQPTDGRLVVKNTKARDAERGKRMDFDMRVPDGAVSLALYPAEGELVDPEQVFPLDVLRTIRSFGEAGATKADLTAEHTFKGTEHFKRTMRTLRENGNIESRGGTRGARYFAVTMDPG